MLTVPRKMGRNAQMSLTTIDAGNMGGQMPNGVPLAHDEINNR
jgi:hypothetical protein